MTKPKHLKDEDVFQAMTTLRFIYKILDEKN